MFLSHRGHEFWPGGGHCDWRSDCGDHRHCRGDCCSEENGKILVSTSHAHTQLESMWMQRVVLMLCSESALLASSKYGAKEPAWASLHSRHILWWNNTGSDVMAPGQRVDLCDMLTLACTTQTAKHLDHSCSLPLNIFLHRSSLESRRVPIYVTAFPRTTPSPLRKRSWAACLANDWCFLCHRSAKNKKTGKSVMVSVNFSVLIPSFNRFNPLVSLNHKSVTFSSSPKSTSYVWCILLLFADTQSQVIIGISLVTESVSVFVANGLPSGWFYIDSLIWAAETKGLCVRISPACGQLLFGV